MPNLNVVTISRPDFELATYLGSLALKHAVDYMRGHGLTVDDLNGNNAVRTKVLDSLSRNDPIFFTGVGHGSPTVFTGQNFNYIWWVCDCRELRGRVVYLLSCLTGQQLGPDMVRNKGAWCYIGYRVEFAWVQAAYIDPLMDRYGKAFFEPVLEIINRLADGYTTGAAYKSSIDKWNYWINYWSGSRDPVAPLVLQLLLWDRDGQVLIGDENARITLIPYPLSWIPSIVGAIAPIGAVLGSIAMEELRKSGVTII
jgi:hypothetical protein